MKLQRNIVTRQGNNTKIMTDWDDRMRRPGQVTILTEKSVSPGPGGNVLIEGDAAEVIGTMTGIAEIAWKMGWRPVGLGEAIIATLTNYEA